MKHALLFLFLLSGLVGFGQENHKQVNKANYELASRFSPAKIRQMVHSTRVTPNWLKSGDFWYSYTDTESEKWYLVNPARGSKTALFDNADMARKISVITKEPHDAVHLGIRNLKFSKDEKSITFQVNRKYGKKKGSRGRQHSSNKKMKKGKDSLQQKDKKKKAEDERTFYLKYTLSNHQLEKIEKDTTPKELRWATYSPDSSAVVYAKNYNLYWMSRSDYEKLKEDKKDSTVVEHALTHSGVRHYAWAGDLNTVYDTTNLKKAAKRRRKARVLWSPDGKYFSLTRKDSRDIHNLWVIHNTGGKRPMLETYKYMMPGEVDSTETELYIFNFQTKQHHRVGVGAFKNQKLSLWSKPTLKTDRSGGGYFGFGGGFAKASIWLGQNDFFYMLRTSRDEKRMDLLKVYTDGRVETLIKERSGVYLSDIYAGNIQQPRIVNNGKELIWWSQRDGWGQLYLYDGKGNLKNQITKGEFHVSQVAGVDEKARKVYFVANGREKGENPYWNHLYSVNFNGSGVKELDRGHFDHAANMDDDHRFFVDNYSRTNTAPKSALYNSNGKKILDLEETDLSLLFEAGYKFPEPIKLKAADGLTDLYGVMYKPFDFDSTKTYPLIEYVYPGPQTEAVNKSFSLGMDHTDRLAQLGFIVITVGNRGGSPMRSEWYHTFGYGNLRDYGLADKKRAAEQIIAKYPFVDPDKIGINGHSGGGFMTAAAMFEYPDFFKVGVSESGNHNNDIYNRTWSERHNGVQEMVKGKDTTFAYSIDRNSDIAKNLKGHLMLATGDIDNNVHPANTIRVIAALIRANKRFDFLLLPNQRHGYGVDSEYFFWRMGEYFAEYLLGDSRRHEVDIKEIQREIPKKR